MNPTIANQTPAFVLASVVTSYPDERFPDLVAELLEDTEVDTYMDSISPERWSVLKEHLVAALENPSLLDDLRAEYIDTFDRGRSANPLYETEYGRGRAMVKGNELADIAAFYKAFGLEIGAEGVSREMLDHVAVELEFYAILLMKQEALLQRGDEGGGNIVLDARRSFLKDHLGRFVTSIASRPGVQDSPFYSTVFGCMGDLVAQECRVVEVQPQRAEWIAGQQEEEAMCCGGGCGDSVPSSAEQLTVLTPPKRAFVEEDKDPESCCGGCACGEKG